jgi:hypothetical protein
MKVTVIGHSHVNALSDGARLLEDGAGLRCAFTFLMLGATGKYDPPLIAAEDRPARLCERLAADIAAAEPDIIVSAVGGNLHNLLGLVNHPTRFDFVLPEAPDLPFDAEAALFPYTAIHGMMKTMSRARFAFLATLKAAAPRLRFHIESPPPVPSGQHIASFPGSFAAKIAELGVAPASLRYKLWQLNSRTYLDCCKALEIAFLPVPAAVQDEKGMMREEFWNRDATHGNAHYGAAVLRALDEHLRGVFPEPAA